MRAGHLAQPAAIISHFSAAGSDDHLTLHVWESMVTPRSIPHRWPMARNKISTTVYITPEQSEKLRDLHGRTKVPVAVYIREGIDLVLQHYGDARPEAAMPANGASNANRTSSTRD